MNLFERIIGIFTPYNCLNCGQEGSLLCAACDNGQIISVPSRCFYCQTLTTDFRTCSNCRRKTGLKAVAVVCEYRDVPKLLIVRYKFRGAREAVNIMTKRMAKLFIPKDIDIIVPLPPITISRRRRGFDHTKLLGRQISRIVGKPFGSDLGRLGKLKQVGASRQTRLSQLEGSFYVRRPEMVRGLNILLIDDIVTTGGSLIAATNVLKCSGAKSVQAIVFAQKLSF